jgi:hypothetical protein
MDDDNLRQADLSHLRLTEMTAAQKAEMQRRYADFVRRAAKKPPAAAAARRQGNVSKWQPGRRM